MKILYYFSLAFAALFLCISDICAQNEIKVHNGKTYVYDYQNQKVYRQQLGRNSIQVAMSDNFIAKQKTPISSLYKSILSKERMEELKSEKMLTKFVCDSYGKVISVEFLFFKRPFLSVEEIEKLEDAFLHYTFDLQVYGNKLEYYKFSLACFFGKL